MSAVVSLADHNELRVGSSELRLSASMASSKPCSYLELVLCVESGSCSTTQFLTGILEIFYPLEIAGQYCEILIQEFGTLTALLHASLEMLAKLVPSSRALWLEFQKIRTAISLTLREAVQEKPLLNDLTSVTEYLTFTIGHDSIESVRQIFLNSKNRLIRDELHSRGTVNSTMVSPRELIKRACEVRANAVILAHNHPSGDPTPSTDDVEMTKHIAGILHAMGISFHDHLIIGKSRIFSFRSAGLLS